MPDLFDVDDLWPDGYERVLELATDEGPAAGCSRARAWRCCSRSPRRRTRNSSEMAVFELGGHPVYIQGTEVGLDTRESAEDIARTLGCYHRIICAPGSSITTCSNAWPSRSTAATSTSR